SDGSSRSLTQGPGGDFQPRFSPDGRRVSFFSTRTGNVDVWVVDVEGGRARRWTEGASVNVNPIFSPDGRRIAYMSDRSGRLEVWTMSSDGAEPHALTQVGVMVISWPGRRTRTAFSFGYPPARWAYGRFPLRAATRSSFPGSKADRTFRSRRPGIA